MAEDLRQFHRQQAIILAVFLVLSLLVALMSAIARTWAVALFGVLAAVAFGASALWARRRS